jgi:adenosylcobinamide-phosphate synthase
MSFVAALIALLLDQIRPPAHARWAEQAVVAWVRALLHWGDTGKLAQARWLAGVAIVLPAALAWGVEWLLWRVNPLLSWLWTVAVLYFVVGFRQFSHGFTAVKAALDAQDMPAARAAYSQWIGATSPVGATPEPDLHALALATATHGIVRTHRNVLAPLFAFALLPGVGGAVLYRVLELCAAHKLKASEAFDAACDTLFYWADTLASRLSGAGFCVVGHFEEAAAAWRSFSVLRISSTAWLTAVSFGALAVRTEPQAAPPTPGFDPAANLGVAVLGFTAPQLALVVGLLWRSVVMWMALFALVQFTAFVA